jgi:MarR family transcriptional regulator, organic hydroperoxide resistance regulator
VDLSKKATASVEYPMGPALEFMQRIWRLNHALESLSSRMQKHFGITAQQRLVLRCIGRYPGITAGQLAALLHVDPGTVSAALNRLELRGLLERRRQPQDQRRSALGLTAAGRALNEPVQGTVENAVEQLLAGAASEELAAAAAVLERLTGLLEAERPT